MYKKVQSNGADEIYFDEKIVYRAEKPAIDIQELKDSFAFVPYDSYFKDGKRYRTTSRIKIHAHGYELLERRPLYQPAYVNKLNSYGGIDRNYDDVPISLLQTRAFDEMIKCWTRSIPYLVETFSIHQIRTTDNGNPTPEGAHRDGTDWTGIYIVNRYNISDDSATTKYWGNDGDVLVDKVYLEGSLINHCDSYFTHCATSLNRLKDREPCFRDIFVFTSPEHGVNRDEEEYRKSVFVAEGS